VSVGVCVPPVADGLRSAGVSSAPHVCSSRSPPAQHSANDLIMQKRAEVAAKLAAMKKSSLAGPAPPKTPAIAAPVPTKPIPPKVAFPTPSPSSTPKRTPGITPPSTSATPAGVPDDLARRVAEAKKRVSEAQTKLAIKDNPYMVRSSHIYFLSLTRSNVGRCSDSQEEGLVDTRRRTSALPRCRSQNGCASSTPRTYHSSPSIQEGSLQAHAAQVCFYQSQRP
jgi:hypothetical protein